MDLSFISEMYIPIVIALCLVVGYILKHWIKDVDNKYIPTVLTVLGAVAACVAAMDFNIELVVAGAVSGLASTGLHQAFKQLIGDKEEKG